MLGGGIAIATQSGDGGENDDTIPSLSGTWMGSIFTDDGLGNIIPLNTKLILTQNGNEITGRGDIETIPIDLVSGTYTYPNVNLTLDAFGAPPAYFQGTVTDKNTITGHVNGFGFNNDPLTLKRQ